MGVTYKAFDNAGNVNFSSYLTGLDALFSIGGPAMQIVYSTGELSSATVYERVGGGDHDGTLFLGHMIAVLENSFQFSIEGEMTGTVGGDDIDDYVNGRVAFNVFTIEAFLAENDILTGNASNNVLESFGGNDRLNGSFGDDVLFGGSGADQLFGGWGADILYGGTENDVLSGEDGDDRLYGGDGIDSIVGGVGADTMDGGVGDDWIRGFEDNDTVYAAAGDDTVDGGDGDDAIYGGDGGDVLVGGAGADRIDGGAGIDFVSYASNAVGVTMVIGRGAAKGGDAQGDQLVSIEYLVGSAFADRLTGSSAAETLNGFTGNDRLVGGGGDDVLIGSSGADVLDGGAGQDTASYVGSVTGIFVNLTAGTASGDHAAGDTFLSIENLIGSDLADRLTGTEAANQLSGALGADTLIGAGGNDILVGDGGDDILTGGAGRDIFRFGSSSGTDTITDWMDRSDRIAFVGGTVDDFSDLTITTSPTGIVSIASADGMIRVNNAQVAKFTEADFIFSTVGEPITPPALERSFHFPWSAGTLGDNMLGHVYLV